MTAELIFEYPTWYILLCLSLAAGLSFLLYYKTELSEEVPKIWVWLLSVLRFGLILILALFLLSPLLKHNVTEVEKPILVVARDNSKSLQLGEDSVQLQQKLNSFNNTIAQLANEFEVRELSFGESVNDKTDVSFNERSTDLSQLFDEVENRFSNRNVGALIVASDGVFNKGVNPRYSTSKIEFPIYCMALGDTVEKTDLAIVDVDHNKLAFVGNQFPVEIDLKAVRAKGEEVKIEILKQGAPVFSEMVNIDRNSYNRTITTLLEANSVGLQRYTVTISSLDVEQNLENNRYDFYIEVLEGRQKILLLAEGPHPDISAVRNAISRNDNYEVKVALAAEFSESLDQYNLVIIHQLNDKTMKSTKYCMQNAIPMLVLHGVNSSKRYFKEFNLGVDIKSKSNNQSDVQGNLVKGFSTFKVKDELASLLKQLPPLKAPFGDYKSSEGINVLLSQRIGSVETNNPILYFAHNGEQKYGVLIGEGIWRWRMAEYSLKGESKLTDELIQKTVQYLAIKDDKKRFRLDYDKQFYENTQITIEAELYNRSYEKINEPDVNAVVVNENGDEFTYVFGKTADAYKLNAGTLPAGTYNFKAITSVDGEVFEEQGQFAVKPVQLEAMNLKADHRLLNTIAQQTNGKLYYEETIGQLGDEIIGHNEIKPISYSHQKLSDLINLKWIFFVLLGLVSLEWFIRKRNGAY